ncbi:hypothetical protein Bca4012_083920 [Brassica carinata]
MIWICDTYLYKYVYGEDLAIPEDYERWMINNFPVKDVMEIKDTNHMALAYSSVHNTESAKESEVREELAHKLHDNENHSSEFFFSLYGNEVYTLVVTQQIMLGPHRQVENLYGRRYTAA